MSDESQQLERSALERKDRDELYTIAVAMGGKPTSRSRKATMIDMILELAGVTTAAPTSGSDTEPSGGEPVGAEAGDAVPGDDESANSGSASSGSADSGSTNDQVDTEAPGVSTSTQEIDSAAMADAAEVADGTADSESGDEASDVSSSGPETPRSAQQDETESGNRRRRRRGRDRQGDRTDEQWQGEPVEVQGVLDLRDEGYGFLRLHGYLPSKDDVYVSVKQVRQFSLRRGDHLKGASRPASRSEKNPALLRIDEVNGGEPDRARNRPRFEDLTPLYPDEKLRLEMPGHPMNMTARIIDLVAPIGKGQRGLIVSPPKAGKTTIMKQIAHSIEANNPDVELIVLLVDERPEEVTDMRRSVKGEVIASTFDRPAEEHTAVTELAIERAKRMVEEGRDVVVILDGITRLARAYNMSATPTGRIMSGGIDTGALYPPKKIFGAARNTEEGGSLTILATALVETGSKMDEVIFEEFKGTGNMELRLDRRLAERRIYPAIDVDASSTRHEELLFDNKQLQMVWKLRRVLSGLAEGKPGAGLEMLIDRLDQFRDNDKFLAEISQSQA